MADENQYYDLVTLLKLDFLDIRKAVRNNQTMKVGEYTANLDKFEAEGRKGLEALKKVNVAESDNDDLQILSDIKNLLEEIGCTKINADIDDIIKAIKRGHTAFAADNALKLLDEYENMYSRTTAAKKTLVTIGGDVPVGCFTAQSVKDALQQIDRGEVTRKIRILAVDDSPVMLNTISSVLGGSYKVHVLAKPTMVEKFLEQITPDLFLLDYEMPEMNGFELIPIIRKFEAHKTTPIVFLTSMGTMEHVSAAAKLGACDFIVKPFQAESLNEKIAKQIFKKN